MWKRVVAPAIVVSILWIAGSSISTYYIHRVYESHSRVLAENVATIRAAWAMQDTLWRLHAIVMESADKERRETRIEATELESAFERHLAEAEKTSFTPEEQTARQSGARAFRRLPRSDRGPFAATGPDPACLPRRLPRKRRRSAWPVPWPNLAVNSWNSTSVCLLIPRREALGSALW